MAYASLVRTRESVCEVVGVQKRGEKRTENVEGRHGTPVFGGVRDLLFKKSTSLRLHPGLIHASGGKP